ncbi:hypothetical protein NKR19_g1245 [Coniochaeta hoffmannii]|uniref:CFEM domain-containing protein n=1 Tax=Coniochaeta hoffmannii TaxID=91930 RepID=A0AA38W069_9PEZI|nr:hypothetical protein NKR19_g1245 [Coniochaeta hoffmannii]
MVVPRHMRPALFVVAALSFFALVEATSSPSVSFSSCVTACIKTESCSTSDMKCMCKSSRSKFLSNVAACMYYKCPDEIRSFDSSFMTPLASACKEAGRQIPQSKIDEADETAELFADKLPSTTAPTTSAKATPKTTFTLTSPATSSESKKTTAAAATTSMSSEPAETPSSSSSSSSADDEDTTTSSTTEDSTTTTADTAATTSTTLARETTSSSSATRAATQSSTSTKSAGRSDPTDSSPFATPQNAVGRSSGASSWVLAGLPLALAVAMR